MLKNPCLQNKFRVERVPPDQVFLLSERDRFILRGSLYYTLAPLLTGDHSTDAIVAALPEVRPEHLYFALMYLEKQGYVEEATASTMAAPEVPPEQHQPALSRIQLVITPDAPASLKAGLRRLARNLEQSLPADQADIPLILTDDYLHPDLAHHNATALASGQPWLLIKPLGEEIWLGPRFEPGKTGCWECLAQRLRGNRPMEQWLDSLEERDCVRQAEPATDEETLAIAQQNILHALDPSHEFHSQLRGEILTLGYDPLNDNTLSRDSNTPQSSTPQSSALQSLASQRHRLTQRPQCSACGEGQRLRSPDVLTTLPDPIQLQSCPKRFTADGGHRSQSPEATLVQLAPQVSPIVGVVRGLRAVAVDGSTVDEGVEPAELENPVEPIEPAESENPVESIDSSEADGEAALLHTYITAHDSGEVSRDLEALKLNLQGRSAGKGKTRTQAKVSGICEAIERYSGIFQGDEPRRQGSYNGLRQQDIAVIHPNDVMRFSNAQYAQRDAWNRTLSDMRHYVPEALDPDAEINWSPLWSLSEERFKYLPTAQCYYGYSTPFCKANSNGCAAGNTREEAILQGFLELVERDAVAIWWGNQAQRPGVALESFDDPYFVALQDHYFDTYDRTLYVLDLTHDLGIPVVAAVSHLIDADPGPDGRPDQKILCGFGAHFEAAIAISRALTEVNQLLTGSVDPRNRTGNRTGNDQTAQGASSPPKPPFVPALPSDPWVSSHGTEPYQPYLSLVDQAHLMANSLLIPSTAQTMPAVRRHDLLEDVQACVEIVRQAGMEMLVLDQTRPDIGLPVIRVVVPGMRHFWRRLAPGRLYDVPIEEGWFVDPRWEGRQNPLPFPF